MSDHDDHHDQHRDQHEDLHEWAGAYAAGALDRDDRHRFEAHLRSCPVCQGAVADLLPVAGALRRLDPTELDLTGDDLEPAPPAVLAGAVAAAGRAQRELARSRSRWRLFAVAAAVVAAAALGGLWAAGRDGAPPQAVGTDLAMNGTATGSVELVAKGWGTQLRFSLEGMPEAGPFVATVRDAAGRSEIACSWGATPSGTVTIDGATSLPPDQLAAVEVTTPDGRVLASADLAPAR